MLLQLDDPVKSAATRLARKLVWLGQMGGHVRLYGGLGLIPLAAVVATERAYIRVRVQVGQHQAFVTASVAADVTLVERAMLRLVVPLHGGDFGKGGTTSTAGALFLNSLPAVMLLLVYLHQISSQPLQWASSALERGCLRMRVSHVSCQAIRGSLQSAAQLAPAHHPASLPSANTIRATPQFLSHSTINQDIHRISYYLM